ncbi:MAG TPA: 2-amino-4-hydroxy-6-hydroxymethyldihydropteridine diphosphokinase [Planctomycetota bacterium]|nr:2-amino-4-hydroxy-6-hydroxymethyldihydropteridine diphosphokinase [Planctomycetota bacterium]
MPLAYVGLGSNLGDRRGLIREALKRLGRLQGVRVRKRSRIIETDPVGRTRQPRFLNAVAEVETRIEPSLFLRRLRAVERALGRVRHERWGPRTIDLDLLLWGDRSMATPRLTLPHPRMAERRFVLAPLAELCPGRRVPGTGRTVRSLLKDMENRAP